jgi:quercetin dioxygenase-like cupin family protein
MQHYSFNFIAQPKVMKAFKLININGTDSSFLEGTVSEMKHINARHFFIQTTIEAYELAPHPAPRYQFVITLKGKLKFRVSDGSTFIIEPGVILIANDLAGKGHTWEIIDGNEWHRIYVVLNPGDDDCFTPLNAE